VDGRKKGLVTDEQDAFRRIQAQGRGGIQRGLSRNEGGSQKGDFSEKAFPPFSLHGYFIASACLVAAVVGSKVLLGEEFFEERRQRFQIKNEKLDASEVFENGTGVNDGRANPGLGKVLLAAAVGIFVGMAGSYAYVKILEPRSHPAIKASLRLVKQKIGEDASVSGRVFGTFTTSTARFQFASKAREGKIFNVSGDAFANNPRNTKIWTVTSLRVTDESGHEVGSGNEF